MHIDFSFMLSYSPGGINFESAPFKLTRELLEARGVCGGRMPCCADTFGAQQVMDSDAEGCASDAFNYFKARAAMRCYCSCCACHGD